MWEGGVGESVVGRGGPVCGGGTGRGATGGVVWGGSTGWGVV